MASADATNIELEKSPGDRNRYEHFTLPNKVQVILIQDNNQVAKAEAGGKGNMAYCSFAMNVGSLNDPKHRQGLAHFLEHMIFMGSEKYPEESAYSDLISSNGGYTNAWTEYEYTNYQF